MNIIGHEIDVDFIYQISPIINSYGRGEICFVLSFKDGKTHKVLYKENYTEQANCKERKKSKFEWGYDGNDLRKLKKMIKVDTENLTNLREAIIAEKNKPKA